MAKPSSFTGRARSKRTSALVRAGDVVSRFMITCGGIGTIIAVCGVFLFLVWVVVPLIAKPEVVDTKQLTAPMLENASPIRLATDEYQIMGYVITSDGEIITFHLDDGKILDRKPLFEGKTITATSFAPGGESVAFGFEDGTVRTGSIRFGTRYLEDDNVPPHVAATTVDHPVEYDGGLVERTPENQLRLQLVDVEFDEPIDIGEGKAIQLLDRVSNSSGLVFAALTSDRKLSIYSVKSRRNLMTGKTTYRIRRAELPYEPNGRKDPKFLELSGLGDKLFIAWPDGHLLRYDTRDMDAAVVAEQVDLVEAPTATMTAMQFMLGNQTLIVGDSAGGLNAWFGVKPDGAATMDGIVMRKVHALEPGAAAVTSVSSSGRSRLVCAGFADGSIRLYQVTTNQMLTEVHPGGQMSDITVVAMAPKDDGFAALGPGEMAAWKIDPKHPEASLSSIFMPVWYEGYPEASHTWQSSSGDDAFEPKLGLFPLVFGTLKATVYSMVFAVPLALLAALYTSEFLHPKIKARVKPLVEMMASLPSVVLGFLAGLVFAPVVERWLGSILASFAIVPFMFLLGAHLWQMLPRRRQILLQTVGIDDSTTYTDASPMSKFFQTIVFRLGGVRLMALLLLLAVGVALSALLGGVAETVLFAGDIKLWMDGQIGSGVGGWVIILLPISAVITAIALSRYVNPIARDKAADWSYQKFAVFDLCKFLVACVAAIALAALLGTILNTLGWDPRGPAHAGSVDVSLFGTYIQRNALIVGFVMGFAVIPIIYTIAEDAMSAVPDHLRSASLGAGATPWQTAVRIIIPTAMSGLFSAIMIGLGRAVGETMIVLMAAGNTPVMEMNIFNGFRTLSANIAVELPEAVKDSTHYRTLFLAALTLFVMTFIVNTFAEIVRLRFRKKAVNL